MRALLDTHAFLWANEDPARLSRRARRLIEDAANDMFLSAASAWEIAIKHAKGRLDLPEPPYGFVVSRVDRLKLEPLPVEISHALRAGALPLVHRDPFDRLLVAQGQLQGLSILTSDPIIARYDVEVIW